MEKGYEHIIVEVAGCVGRLILNKPPLNILNIQTLKEMNSAFEKFADDNGIKAVVISSEGKAFSAGVDVKDHTLDNVNEMIRLFHRVFHLIDSTNVPVICQVSGAALGGGCELATFCDIVYASQDATFGQPEIKVGVFPPLACVTFPRMMGWKKAIELILTGEIISADRAKELGLINRVVPREKLAGEVERFVANLLTLSGAVLRLTKKAMREGLDKEFEKALGWAEDIYLDELMRTEDASEGLTAFLEKREPVWQNR